jgi:hypothetical protein
MIVAKFSTLAGGVWIEVRSTDAGPDHTPDARCFRFDEEGRAEYAWHSDLTDGDGTRARWYGHQARAANFILC